jgi:osmoprotectant transport system ATP-binding protein
VLVRLEDPTRGRVVLDGVDLTALRGRRLRAHRRHIQMVFQDPVSSLDPRQPVGAALDEVLTVHGLRRAGRGEELLDLVGLPAGFAQRLPHEMSGGQRQRVGVARALAAEPTIMLLDEPFGALDPLTRDRIQETFLKIKRAVGLTAMFVTHDMGEALLLADRIAVLRSGKLIQVGTPRELVQSPADGDVERLLDTPRRHARHFEGLLDA